MKRDKVKKGMHHVLSVGVYASMYFYLPKQNFVHRYENFF